MKKVLILGANSYIGNSFQKYIGENYNDQYEVHKSVCVVRRGKRMTGQDMTVF